MQNDNLNKFIDQIIIQARLDKMPKDFLDEYSKKLKIEAMKRLGIAAVKELKEEQIEEFNKLSESSGDQEKINEYLEANIENFEEKMTQALTEFGQEVVSKAKSINK